MDARLCADRDVLDARYRADPRRAAARLAELQLQGMRPDRRIRIGGAVQPALLAGAKPVGHFHRRRAVRCPRARPLCRGALPRADIHGEVRAAAERGRLPRLCANQEGCRRGALVLSEDGANPDARRRALLLRTRRGRRADDRNAVRDEVAGNGALYPAHLARADPDDGADSLRPGHQCARQTVDFDVHRDERRDSLSGVIPRRRRMGADRHGVGVADRGPPAPYRHRAAVGAADRHIAVGCRARDAAGTRARTGDGDRGRLCGSGARIARPRRAGAARAARRPWRGAIRRAPVAARTRGARRGDPSGASSPAARRRRADSGRDIVAHRRGFGLDLVDAIFDEIADRHEAHHLAAMDDGQVTDALLRHLR